MNPNSDQQPATSAAVTRLTVQASGLTADAHDVRGFGGLTGGVLDRGFGVAAFGIGTAGAARDDVQMLGSKPGVGSGSNGSAVHPVVQPFSSRPSSTGEF